MNVFAALATPIRSRPGDVIRTIRPPKPPKAPKEPRPPKAAPERVMTRDEATEIRSRQQQGEAVPAGELQQALYILSKRRYRRLVLPKLNPDHKAYVNTLLCYRLGLACGKVA